MGKIKGAIKKVVQENSMLKLRKKKGVSKAVEKPVDSFLKSKKRVVVPKMTPKKAEAIKTNLPSERVQSSTPQMSMAQIGKSMSKSGPRKNLRETVAAVKGKLQKAYSKVAGKNK